MAEQHGGYRKPSSPAPVSGPGALSQRTDGGATQAGMVAPGGEYGSRQEMEAIQSGAAMAARPALPGLGDPSARPDEPITAGAALGPGAGPLAAGILDDQQATNQQIAPLLESLERVANLPGSTAETRAFVRNLKARLSNG